MANETGGPQPLGARPRTTGPDTGGADLGAMSQVGGSIPGFRTLTGLATDVAPALGELALRRRANKPGKDYNDDPTTTTAGSDQGRPVEDPGELDI